MAYLQFIGFKIKLDGLFKGCRGSVAIALYPLCYTVTRINSAVSPAMSA